MLLFLCHFCSYWITVCYTYRYPQHKPTLPLQKIIPVVLVNQIITGLAMHLLLTDLTLTSLSLSLLSALSLSLSLMKLITITLLMTLMLNLFFTLLHYICHRCKPFYRHIHHMHHKAIISQGASALYCHPLEHIFVNLVSAGLPIVLMNNFISDQSIVLAYIIFITVNTVLGHTSYKVNRSPHTEHHKLANVNYDNTPNLIDRFILNSFKMPQKSEE